MQAIHGQVMKFLTGYISYIPEFFLPMAVLHIQVQNITTHIEKYMEKSGAMATEVVYTKKNTDCYRYQC